MHFYNIRKEIFGIFAHNLLWFFGVFSLLKSVLNDFYCIAGLVNANGENKGTDNKVEQDGSLYVISSDSQKSEKETTTNKRAKISESTIEPQVETVQEWTLEPSISAPKKEFMHGFKGYLNAEEGLFEKVSPMSAERIQKLKYHFKSIRDYLCSDQERLLFYICQNLSNTSNWAYKNVSFLSFKKI